MHMISRWCQMRTITCFNRLTSLELWLHGLGLPWVQFMSVWLTLSGYCRRSKVNSDSEKQYLCLRNSKLTEGNTESSWESWWSILTISLWPVNSAGVTYPQKFGQFMSVLLIIYKCKCCDNFILFALVSFVWWYWSGNQAWYITVTWLDKTVPNLLQWKKHMWWKAWSCRLGFKVKV